MKTLFLSFSLFLFSFCLFSQTNSPVQEGQLIPYNYARLSPQNTEFKMKANGKEIFVYNTSAAPFAAFSCSGPVVIEIELPARASKVSVSPKKYGISVEVTGNKAKFTIPGPMLLALEFDIMPEMYIYANPVEKNAPEATAPGVKYFKAGQIYEVGELRLKDNETLYIEGGAVVRGCVRATSAKNVHIAGYGILDGGYYKRGVDGHRSIVFEDCCYSSIENIIMIEPSSWMIMLGICQNVLVKNVKELGFVASSDGIDIVGSKQIKVENCMFRNGDDCVAIKSLDLREHGSDASLDYSQDVDSVLVSRCTFVSYLGGAALEIGHELRTGSVRNIRFADCDILGVHGWGGIFGIHNADRATVSNISYENIHVEHHYNKLVDLKVIKSMWGKDAERGQIRNVSFKNIDATINQFNPGYSVSLIGGYDTKHTIENVSFENFRLNGKIATTADELDLYVKQAKEIQFKF